MTNRTTGRREFLKFLAASPYVASIGGLTAFLSESALSQSMQPEAFSIAANPAEAINVFDLEATAKQKVSPGHWWRVASGVDDDGTIRANRDGFQHLVLKPRRLRDPTKVDMHVNLFGTAYNSPIFTCPIGGQRSFHPEGEVAVARAAKARGTPQCLSTSSSTAVEDVNAALGRPVWYQLYAPGSWDACEKILRRVEAAGCNVIALTVDTAAGGRNETYLRNRPKDLTQCASCHKVVGNDVDRLDRPMHAGIDMSNMRPTNPALDWAWADRIRKFWKGKMIIKGLETPEDARLCIEHGIDGILVSNHGGRSLETLRPTIESLPDVVAEVKGRIPVLVDGGFRRGTDIFKALALGATAVGIGRPTMWGLGSFGQAGVDRVLEMLQGELKMVMGNCGTRTVADITASYVLRR
ncbi:MAG TPA: alpha-hydroxy acid oxidase [Terriglobales bacterium]|nr:alpha-hydroxy acid oxidase [Terriglobales bacterium]